MKATTNHRQPGGDPMTPAVVIMTWSAADWDERTRTASRYAYRDAETGQPVTLTGAEADQYTWSDVADVYDAAGRLISGEQRGELRADYLWRLPPTRVAPSGGEFGA